MKTVLLIHGTGIREPFYTQFLDRVTAALEGHARVEACYWGGPEGCRLEAGGASIPRFDLTRTAADAFRLPEDDSDHLLVLWQLLGVDPLLELRLLEALANGASLPANDSNPLCFDRVTHWRDSLADVPRARERIESAGLSLLLEEACRLVSAFDELSAILRLDPRASTLAVARAIVATALVLATEQNVATPARIDPWLRDEVVCLLDELLADKHGSPAVAQGVLRSLIKKPLLGFARNLGADVATNHVRRRRGAISDATSPTAGDILLYQARGEGIRRFIRERIRAIEGPVVLLAHSLGGVASVDLLIAEDFPAVELLITLGSQAPYFYEIGALTQLPFANEAPAQRLPPHFPTWMNFYDHRDFLSFVAQPLFGGTKVADFCVDNRLAFPDSHSGYFSNPQVWAVVTQALAQP